MPARLKLQGRDRSHWLDHERKARWSQVPVDRQRDVLEERQQVQLPQFLYKELAELAARWLALHRARQVLADPIRCEEKRAHPLRMGNSQVPGLRCARHQGAL